MSAQQQQDPDHFTRRDAETLWALGIFLMVLAAAVLVGTFFAVRPHAMVVNVVAGLIILSIGGGMFWRGLSVKRSLK